MEKKVSPSINPIDSILFEPVHEISKNVDFWHV